MLGKNPNRSKDNNLLVKYDSWEKLLKARREEYTLSIKDMCQTLKCSRSWAQKYLKPHLHYIYISNGVGFKPNYVLAANMRLKAEFENHQDFTETTWYSKTEFTNLIKNSLMDITKQTIVVPIEDLIKGSKIEAFTKDFSRIQKEILAAREKNDSDRLITLLMEKDNIIKACATDRGKKIWNDPPNIYKRSETQAVKCSLNTKKIDIYSLQAVHDLKGYGDSDEEIYRRLFSEGYYRLVLRLPDADGVSSEKIYYYKDYSAPVKSLQRVLAKYICY